VGNPVYDDCKAIVSQDQSDAALELSSFRQCTSDADSSVVPPNKT
jgi:hypothetical protein